MSKLVLSDRVTRCDGGLPSRPSCTPEWELSDELPNEDVMNVEMMPPWKTYFDAEYQALILGLEATTELNNHQLDICGDSKLVINQLLGDYKVRKPELIPNHGYAKRLLQSIDLLSINHVLRKMNKQADALTGLASSLTYPGAKLKVPDGLYAAQEVYISRSYLLANEEGLKVGPINGRYMKKQPPP
ncbi:hypothetical protein LIER_00368 [Lithospermum erythrorhizon]|uniref:RNase H type-1 domain-containing protein n=1 Tax=Lithospermum erythrorhizon TaxID=34254 RepID=A0AAV3NJK1_LITER